MLTRLLGARAGGTGHSAALAAVVVNGLKWRVRAPYVAKESFRAALFPEPPKGAKVAKQPSKGSSKATTKASGAASKKKH